MEKDLDILAAQVAAQLIRKNLTISTAESCTGGLLGHILTSISGSSNYFIGGVIAYSNRIKELILGVSQENLLKFGAVSEPVAQEMAASIRDLFNTDIGISTTGIAGPTGGTAEKPVGLVWIGVSTKVDTRTFQYHLSGNMDAVKHSTVVAALSQLLEIIDGDDAPG